MKTSLAFRSNTQRCSRFSLFSFAMPAFVSVAALSGAVGISSAQAADERVIEDILVTARKRSETLQDVPFAIAALNEERLRETGSTDLESFSKNVAGLSVQNLGPGQSQVAIRGISAGQIVRDQPGVKEQVGVYMDESVISLSLFTPDLDFYDANRIEVLRGPQGTLFGSGSLSGTVRYITNQPSLEEFEASVDATLNYIDDGELGGDLKGMINVPLSDTVAFRGVAYHTEYGGFIDAIQPNGSTDDDVNSGDRTGVRLALLIEPSERLRMTPRIVYQEIEVNGYNRQDEFNILANPYTTTRPPVSIGEREAFLQLEEKFKDDFLLVDFTFEYDFDEITLTSVTSYTDRDVLVLRDATALTASITAQPDILAQPEAIYSLDSPLFDETEVEVITQEIRLSSNSDGPIQWVGGLFYSTIERNYGQTLLVTGFEDASGIPTSDFAASKDELFYSRIPYDLDQIALFGELSFDIAEDWNVTFGVRYFDFEEDRNLTFAGIFAVPTDNVPGNTSSDGFSPRLLVSYDLNDDVRLNGQISKGFRLGGINDPLNEPLCSPNDLATYGGNPTFDDEELWNYEIGAKMDLMEGSATLNVAAFYSKVDDLQATLDAGTCSSRVVINVAEATSYGIEFELFAHPTDNFEFGLAGSWIKAELGTTVTDSTGTNVLGGIEDGNQLPTSPEFQVAVVANMTFDLMEDWEGFWNVTYQFVDSRYTQIGDQADGFGTINLQTTPIGAPNQNTFSIDPELDSYDITNFRIGGRNEKWEVAFFINNVFDEAAELSLDRERGGRARFGYQTSQPRTLGITTRISF